MIKTILALPGRDDSTSPCVTRAVSIAKSSGASITLLRVAYEPQLEGYMGNSEIYAPLRRRLLDESQAQMDAAAQQVRSQGLKCTATAAWSGDRHEEVARQVLLNHVDLVVVEPSASASGLSHADWKLISTCPAPILVVRGDGKAPYRHVVAAVDPYHEHGKPAELDAAILKNARSLADVTGADLRVVHCFSPIGTFAAVDLANLPAAQAEAALEAARRTALDDLLAQEGIPADRSELLPGRPENVLSSLVEQGKADLLVLGAATRGRIREFFIGSTAERLLHEAAADVLVVKPEDFRVSLTLGRR